MSKLSELKRLCTQDPLAMALRIEELEEKLKAFEWQPIETAPQDGTFVLVWNSHGVNEVYFDEDEDCWCHDIDSGAIFTLRGSHPTEWMPLPPPPKP